MNLGMQGFPVSHLLWSSKEEAVSEALNNFIS